MRPIGSKKTPGSGRSPGTPNKRTLYLQSRADELGVHPFDVLLYLAGGRWEELGYPSRTYVEHGKDHSNEYDYVSPEIRTKAASEACQYLYPKRKSIEWKDTTETAALTGKKSFAEFCEAAGYPKPFDKQIEMSRFALEEEVPRLLLGSRGYGKTDYITIQSVGYDIYLRGSDSTNLIITKSSKRNTSIIAEIASGLKANGVDLERENATQIRIKGHVGKDESVECLTIKTSMRGRHPNRVVMDDPTTDEDVSEAMRLLVKRRYNEVMKLTSNVIVIGQPAHKDDLYAELRGIVKTLEMPFGTIPELDHDLEAQRLAGVDEASIAASYYLKIVSEGQSPFDRVKFMDKFPSDGSAVAFIDPSFEGGDWSAVSIIKQHMQGIAVVGFCWKRPWNLVLDQMIPHFIKYGVKRVAFETNSLGDLPVEMLRKITPASVGVVGLKSNTNKHSRIMAAGAFAHMIHISKESDREYVKQVQGYEFGCKHDDCPDSLASGMSWIGLIKGKQ